MTQPPPALPSLEPLRGPALPAWDFLARNRHITVPLAVPPGFLAAGGALAHLPASGVPTAVGAGVLSAAVWWAAPHKWDRTPEQWYARLSALAAGCWLSATAIAGLGLPELIAAAPLALAWGIPWWWHKRTRKHSGKVLEQWQQWWLYYARNWGLHGSHLIEVTTQGVIDTLTVQLHAGHQTIAGVKEILPKLESALQGHVEHRMTRCEVVKGNPSQVLIHLKRANPHDVTVQWDESLAPSSVTEPAPLGKGESGAWKYGPLLENWFIIGRKRSGKSNEASVMLASWTACRDAQPPWIVDLKGGRTARPWAECADWIATTIPEARLLFGCAEAELRARAELWYTGREQAVPDEVARALLVAVDEANNVLSDMKGDKTCQNHAAAVASEGGAVCVHEWVMTQYGALYESVGSEQLRSNLPARMCFAVSQADHGQFALDDWKNLDASRLENQGEFYYRIAHDEASAPARGPEMTHDLVREIAARNAQIERPPLRLFCGNQVAYTADGRDVTWQEVYDTRWDRAPAAFRPAHVAAPPEVPVSPAPAAEPPWAEALRRIEDEAASIPDLAAPPPVDDATLRRSVEDKKRLWAHLLQQAPAQGVKPSQLEAGSGLGHTWTQEQLKALTGLGVVTKISTGRYAPVAGQDAWAGLERIRRANDDLAEQARHLVGASP